jgi:hypothetical protein
MTVLHSFLDLMLLIYVVPVTVVMVILVVLEVEATVVEIQVGVEGYLDATTTKSFVEQLQRVLHFVYQRPAY